MASPRSGMLRALVSGAVLGSAWLFCSQAIVPLRVREREYVVRLGELQARIDGARKAMIEVKDSEQEAGLARAALNESLGERPQDSVMVSFPERIKAHFSAAGLPVSVVRLNTTQDDPVLPGYQRAYWSVGLVMPATEQTVSGLLFAVAELGERDRFSKVVDFVLQPDAEDPHRRSASINIGVLFRK